MKAEPFSQGETFGWFEAAIWIFGAFVFAVFIAFNWPLLRYAFGVVL